MINSPTLSNKRIQELDLFRGFAILGIFMVNILVMNISFAYRGEWEAEQTDLLQRISFFILETFFYSKFFTMFSFLFGIGVALQFNRAKANGTYNNAFFLRRFVSLFLIGVLHILLLWAGDILHLYGMLGILLMIFFRASPTILLWSSIIIFSFPFYSAVFEQLMSWCSYDYAAPLASLSRAEILELKHHGSYWSGIVLRLKEYSFASGLIYAGITPVAFSMMLFGGYLVKTGWIQRIPELIRKVKTYLLSSVILLLVYRLCLLYLVLPSFEIEHGSALSIALVTLFQLSDISISLTFIWLIAYLWNEGKLKTFLAPLQFVGRMALTNYILQSLIGYLIMRTLNGYESFSPFECILIVMSVYLSQIFFSKWWLNKYKFGPLEWVWRCVSYFKVLPIKK